MIKFKIILASTTMFLPSVMSLLTQDACASSGLHKSAIWDINNKQELSIITQCRQENVNAKEKYLKKKNSSSQNETYWANQKKWSPSLNNLDKLHYLEKFQGQTHNLRIDSLKKRIVAVIQKDFADIKRKLNCSVDKYCRCAEKKGEILSLVNGCLMGEGMHRRIHNENEYNRNKNDIKAYFEKIVNDIMNNFNQTKVELNGTTCYLDSLISKIAKGTSNKEYDFVHDMRCYLEQFWYICDGKDKQGDTVKSVVEKVATKKVKVKDDFKISNNNININNNIRTNDMASAPAAIGTDVRADAVLIKEAESRGLKKLSNQELGKLWDVYDKLKEIEKRDIVHAYYILKSVPNARCCGLPNQGATCYLNTILQGVANQKDFISALLSHGIHRWKDLKGNSRNPNEAKFTIAFIKTMCHMLINQNDTNYAPTELATALEKINPTLVNQIAGGDSSAVFMNGILPSLHTALQFPCQGEQTSVVCDSFANVSKSNSTYHCDSGDYSQSNLCTDLFYNFPLSEVVDYKKKTQGNLIPYSVSIDDCLKFFQQPNQLNDEAYCPVCKKISHSGYQQEKKFVVGGKILTFTINRGDTKNFCATPIEIPRILDFGQYCTQDKKAKYRLATVVCYQRGGHYTTFNNVNGKWFWYNDSLVYDLSDPKNSETRAWFEPMLDGNPEVAHYPTILFYKRLDDDAQPVTQEELQWIESFNTEIAKTTSYIKALISKANEQFHIRGLRNLGATCYMNSLLQALAGIIPLKEFLIKDDKIIEGSQNASIERRLVQEFRNVVTELWRKGNNPLAYAPEKFQLLLQSVWPQFQLGSPNDVKDLVYGLLEEANRQLSTDKELSPEEVEAFSDKFFSTAQRSEISALRYLIGSSGKLDSSIIKQLFGSVIHTKHQCGQCHNVTHNMTVAYNHILPMYNVPSLKQNKSDQSVSLRDCIADYTKPEKSSGNLCKKCNGCWEMTLYPTFFYCPPVLTFTLDYGQGKRFEKAARGLVIPLNLNMTPEISKRKTEYFLSTVCVHIGESGATGHYVTLVQHTPGGDLYLYNDSTVDQLTKNGTLTEKGKKYQNIVQNWLKGKIVVSENFTPYYTQYQRKDLYDQMAKTDDQTIPLSKYYISENNNINNQNQLINNNQINLNNQMNNMKYQIMNNLQVMNNPMMNNPMMGNQMNNINNNNINMNMNNMNMNYPVMNGQPMMNNQMMNNQMMSKPMMNNNVNNNMNNNIPMINGNVMSYQNPNGIFMPFNPQMNIVRPNITALNNPRFPNQPSPNFNGMPYSQFQQNPTSSDEQTMRKIIPDQGGFNLNTNLINNNSFSALSSFENQTVSWVKNLIPANVQNNLNRGLPNVGSNSCFVLAPLHCLANIIPLKTLFSQYSSALRNTTFSTSEYKVTKDIISLINGLWDSSTLPRENWASTLIDLRKNLEMVASIKASKAGDAFDVIDNILRIFSKTMSEQPSKPSNFVNIDWNAQELRAQNETFALADFLNGSLNELYFNPIRRMFLSKRKIEMTCNSCKKTKFSFQNDLYFNFILKKCKEDQECVYSTNNIQIPKKLSLYDCFSSNLKTESLEGNDMIYCNSCGGLKPAKMTESYQCFSPVLIIKLNRGKNNLDYGISNAIDIPSPSDILDLSAYAQTNPTDAKYSLVGIIVHVSGDSGHFMAYCRKTPDDEWHQYDDSTVTKVSKKIIENVLSNNQIHNSGISAEREVPYVLVYMKKSLF